MGFSGKWAAAMAEANVMVFLLNVVGLMGHYFIALEIKDFFSYQKKEIDIFLFFKKSRLSAKKTSQIHGMTPRFPDSESRRFSVWG